MEISGAFVSANKHILAGPAIMRYSQGQQAEIDPGTGAVELFPFEVTGTPKHIV